MENAIVLAPEVLGHIGGLPLTNTLLTSWVVMAILTILALVVGLRVRTVPESKLQNVFEIIIEAGYDIAESLAHSKTKIFFPIVMTFFIYIWAGNLIGLLPGFGTIGFNELEHGKEVFIPLFRSVYSDLNMTLSLALFSAILTHAFSLHYLGIKNYLKRWFTLNPIFLFVGLLELVGEFTKVVSLSFRLFGNIFAGEVVLATVATIFAFVVPLPFYFLEIVVGFVQAAVFMMLTLVFMVLLSEKHGEEH